jgi:hypothetical protein
MKLTNHEIYNFANAYSELFKDSGDIYIPAKANFFLQKNVQVISTAAQEVEKSRLDIIRHYGEEEAETGNIVVPKEKLEEASKELTDLYALEQELDIKFISIDDLANVEFTQSQMQLIMLFIQEV